MGNGAVVVVVRGVTTFGIRKDHTFVLGNGASFALEWKTENMAQDGN